MIWQRFSGLGFSFGAAICVIFFGDSLYAPGFKNTLALHKAQSGEAPWGLKNAATLVGALRGRRQLEYGLGATSDSAESTKYRGLNN